MSKIFPYKIQQAKTISKWISTPFLIVDLCFGMKLGFLNAIPERYIKLIKCISIVMLILYILTIIGMFYSEVMLFIESGNRSIDYQYFYVMEDSVFFCMTAIQYFIFMIVLVFEKYSLFDFLLDSYNIHEKNSILSSDYYGVACAIYLFGMYILKTCTYFIFSWHSGVLAVLYTFLYSTPILCKDTVALELLLVYLSMYRSMTSIKDSFEDSTLDVKSVQERYVALKNCFDKIKPHYNCMLFFQLIFDLPKLLGLLWGTLVYIKQEVLWPIYFIDYLYAFHTVLQIILPSWMAQKTNVQIDRLKILLHQQLLESVFITTSSQQEATRRADNPEVIRFLRYLEAHQLDHTLWGVTPVDLQLPVALFSLCSTYFIVIIQFSHLYG